ncbi:TPA: hypothetical protein L3932_004430 [Pseudomonas aeruginosa]|nr:hypothetical protein [Pseudomonas aeruginosa]
MSHDVIDCEDIVMPPRFVDAWGKPRRSRNKDDKVMVTFQMTTIEERQTLFPSPRLVDEPMSIKDFSDVPCYELHVNGVLKGLATIDHSVSIVERELIIQVELVAIHLDRELRKQGFGRAFLECIGREAGIEAMTHILRERSAATADRFTVNLSSDPITEEGAIATEILLGIVEDLILNICANWTIRPQVRDDS